MESALDWQKFLAQIGSFTNFTVGETSLKGWAWVRCRDVRLDLVHLSELMKEPSLSKLVPNFEYFLIVDPRSTPLSFLNDAMAVKFTENLLLRSPSLNLTQIYDNVRRALPLTNLDHLRQLLDSIPTRIAVDENGIYQAKTTVAVDASTPSQEMHERTLASTSHPSTLPTKNGAPSVPAVSPLSPHPSPAVLRVDEETDLGNSGSLKTSDPNEPTNEDDSELLQAFVHLMLLVAQADDRMVSDEINYLKRLFDVDLGVAPKVLKEACQVSEDANGTEFSPIHAETMRRQTVSVRKLVLRSALELAHADGEYHAREAETLREFCLALDFDENYLTLLEIEADLSQPELARDLASLELRGNVTGAQVIAQLALLQNELSLENLTEESALFSNLAALQSECLASASRRVQAQLLQNLSHPVSQSVYDTQTGTFVRCKKLRKALEDGLLYTLGDILKTPPSDLCLLKGWMANSWSKLSLYMEVLAKQNSESKPTIEAYLKRHQILVSPIVEMASGATGDSLFETIKQVLKDVEPLAFWQLEQLLQTNGIHEPSGTIREALERGQEEGWILELAYDRFVLKENCGVLLTGPDAARLEALALRCLRRGLEVNCYEDGWRPGLMHLDEDTVDYALSRSPLLVRKSPGLYASNLEDAPVRLPPTEPDILVHHSVDPTEQQTLDNEREGIDSMLGIFAADDGLMPFWKIRERVGEALGGQNEESLEHLLERAVLSGELFELSGKRYALPQRFALLPPQIASLHQLAMDYLDTAEELNVFECAWRPGHRALSADEVDFALSLSPHLQRTQPSRYKASSTSPQTESADESNNTEKEQPNVPEFKIPADIGSVLKESLALGGPEELLHLEASDLSHAPLTTSQWNTLKLAALAHFICTSQRKSVQRFARCVDVVVADLTSAQGEADKGHSNTVCRRILETLADADEPQRLESWADRNQMSLPLLIESLKEIEQIEIYTYSTSWAGLESWDYQPRKKALEACWPTFSVEFRKHFETLSEDRFGPKDWQALSEILREKPSLDDIIHFRHKLEGDLTSRPIQRTLKFLDSRLRPAQLSHLLRNVDLDRRYRDSFQEMLKECDEIVFYPFGSGDWVGLASWGDVHTRDVVSKCWPWLRVHLLEIKDGTAQGNFTKSDWAAIAGEAQARGESTLVPLSVLEQAGGSVDSKDTLLNPYTVADVPPEEDSPAGESLKDESAVARAHETVNFPQNFLRSLLKRAGQLSKPYSVAELRVTKAEFESLGNWWGGLNPTDMYQWFEHSQLLGREFAEEWSHHEGFGFLFLVFLSELTRRRGREGSLWPVVVNELSPTARRELFVGNVPRATTARCLEAAVRRAGVRQAYARAGSQGAYLTVFLQLGFTEHGIGRLPKWLSEGASATQSIDLLVAESDCVFARTWQYLKSFRRGRLDIAQMRSYLRNCPFILPEWIEEILATARAQESQAKGRDSYYDSDVSDPCATPRLAWAPHNYPSLVLSVAGLLDDLSESAYDILQDEQLVGRAIKNSSGFFQCDPPSLELGVDQAYTSIVLVGDDTEEEIQQTINHYPEKSGPVVFDLQSGLTVEGRLKPGRQYALLVRSDDIDHTSLETYELPALQRILCRTDGEHGEQTLYGDYEDQTAQELPWRARVKLACYDRSVDLNHSFEISVTSLPSGASILWARTQGIELIVKQRLGDFSIHGTLSASFAKTGLSIELGLEIDGRTYRLERVVSLPVHAVTVLENGEWVAGHHLTETTVREARERPFRTMLAGRDHQDFALVEGDVFVRRPARHPAPIDGLDGFGASLYLRAGPYNSPSDGYLITKSVVNRGILQGFDARGEKAQLYLGRHIVPDSDYRVCFWDLGRELLCVPGTEIEVTRNGVWNATIPRNLRRDNLVVGVAYQGRRIAAYWLKDVEIPESPFPIAETASLIRWFQLPVLSESLSPSTQRFCQCHWPTVLKAWIEEREIPDHELIHQAESRGWYSVVRKLLRTASQDQLRSAWNTMFADCAIEQSLETLVDVDPVLAVRMVLSLGSQIELEVARKSVLGLKLGVDENVVERRLREVANAAAQEMGVDSVFIERTCESVCDLLLERTRSIENHLRRNFATGCNVDTFRRYFAGLLFHRYMEMKCPD